MRATQIIAHMAVVLGSRSSSRALRAAQIIAHPALTKLMTKLLTLHSDRGFILLDVLHGSWMGTQVRVRNSCTGL